MRRDDAPLNDQECIRNKLKWAPIHF